MARTAVTVQSIVATGVGPTYTAAIADGHKFTNDGRVFIHVKNGSGGPIDTTIVTPRVVSGLAVADQVVTIPATGERMIGPFDPGNYNQPSGADQGMVYVDYATTTSMTIGIFKLP